MTAALMLALAVAGGGDGQPPPVLEPLTSGEASYYAAGVMERVADYWLDLGVIQPCADCIGMVALDARHTRLRGERVWLQRDGRDIEGPFQAVDFGRFRTPGRVAEVDNDTARRWGMAAPVKVTVWEEETQ